MASTSALQAHKSVSLPKAVRAYTLLEYLHREEKSLHKHEFFNGKIVRMAGGNATHNQIAAQMTAALIAGVEDLPQTYIVYNSDMKIYIPAYNHGVYSDSVVICEKPEYWGGRKDIITNPLVVVEVLSNSTEDYDRHEKFLKYQTIPVFREYILIRQDICSIESWYREDVDLWRKKLVTDMTENLFLRSINCAVPLRKVYKNVSL